MDKRKPVLPARSIKERGGKYLTILEETALALYIVNKCRDLPGCLKKAGYTGNCGGKASRLKISKKAVTYLEARIDKALKVVNKDADDVLNEISLIAFQDPKNLFKKDDKNATVVKDVLEMGVESRTIRKIECEVKELFGSSGEVIGAERKYKYEMWSKDAALRLMAEAKRLIGPHIQVDAKIIMPILHIPDDGRNPDKKVI